MTLTLRSRFSSGTKTDCSPRNHECASLLPSMVGFSRFMRRRMSGVRLKSTMPEFSRISWASRMPVKYRPVSPPRNARASPGVTYSQPISCAYFSIGF